MSEKRERFRSILSFVPNRLIGPGPLGLGLIFEFVERYLFGNWIVEIQRDATDEGNFPVTKAGN
jgi:hypothetical protein